MATKKQSKKSQVKVRDLKVKKDPKGGRHGGSGGGGHPHPIQ